MNSFKEVFVSYFVGSAALWAVLGIAVVLIDGTGGAGVGELILGIVIGAPIGALIAAGITKLGDVIRGFVNRKDAA